MTSQTDFHKSASMEQDRSKLKPQKSILKTEKSFITTREKTNITFERYPSDTDLEKQTTTNSLVARRTPSGKKNFLIKDLNVSNIVGIGKLPAIAKEYTAWVLNTNFKPPSYTDDFETSDLNTDWSNFKEEVFSKVESDLNRMLKREKSSRRRCDKIENRR